MSEMVILGVGDVGPIHEPMDKYVTLVRSTLEAADLRIGMCERIYSDRGALQLHSGVTERPLKPSMLSIYSDCAFDVVSVAGNHAMDWGPEPLLDTIDMLHARGIKTVGGGRNLEEARKPAFVERKGVRVAVLAYCSVLHEGYEAGPNKAGIAPLRARTFYEQAEHQPGNPPNIITIPYPEDVTGMVADIQAAKKAADVVVLSLHWGIHFIPRVIADYQVTIAEAAFGAGADIIMGHHAHVPKAIAVHQGKVCFYSLSHFIMTTNFKSRLAARHPGKTMEQALKAFARKYGVEVRNDDPLPWGTHSKHSLIAKAVVNKAGVQKVSFLPVLIDRELRPEILKRGDPRFDESVEFMDWVSEDFNHKFVLEGDEVLIASARP
jgi:poly-gamma-glutamate synthesis protein (capsule biosynthesis protein)